MLRLELPDFSIISEILDELKLLFSTKKIGLTLFSFSGANIPQQERANVTKIRNKKIKNHKNDCTENEKYHKWQERGQKTMKRIENKEYILLSY